MIRFLVGEKELFVFYGPHSCPIPREGEYLLYCDREFKVEDVSHVWSRALTDSGQDGDPFHVCTYVHLKEAYIYEKASHPSKHQETIPHTDCCG